MEHGVSEVTLSIDSREVVLRLGPGPNLAHVLQCGHYILAFGILRSLDPQLVGVVVETLYVEVVASEANLYLSCIGLHLLVRVVEGGRQIPLLGHQILGSSHRLLNAEVELQVLP